MHYQTFRGADVGDALSAVRAALGDDALIQSTRHVSNGRRGRLGRDFVEIVAAPGGPRSRGRRNPFSPDIGSDGARHRPLSLRPAKHAARLGGGRQLDPASVEAELLSLREMLEEMSATRPPRERACAMLHAAGIEGRLAKELAKGATRAARGGPAKLRSWLVQRLAERITVRSGIVARARPTIVACVGATGVGKTTTLAKLAARAHLDAGRKVGVVSLDTFRVGAVDQWARYAKLIGVPFAVATDREAFRQRLSELRADLVLVDTPGRSPADLAVPNRLADCLAGVAGHDVHVALALPAWLRATDAERTLAVFGEPAPTEIVITKIDETFQMGGVLHAAIPAGIPFSYLCDGPRVPEDIHDARTSVIAESVMAEEA